jgi:hypothetical protein
VTSAFRRAPGGAVRGQDPPDVSFATHSKTRPHDTRFRVSSCRIHSTTRFQLALFWSTNLSSMTQRRLSTIAWPRFSARRRWTSHLQSIRSYGWQATSIRVLSVVHPSLALRAIFGWQAERVVPRRRMPTEARNATVKVACTGGAISLGPAREGTHGTYGCARCFGAMLGTLLRRNPKLDIVR